MSDRWSTEEIQLLEKLLKDGVPLKLVAPQIGKSRNAVGKKAAALNLHAVTLADANVFGSFLARSVLPAGHPVTWGAITQGTCLASVSWSELL